LAANFISVYQTYSKWAEKVAEDVATGMFDFLDKVGPRGAAANLTTGAIKSTGMGGALVVMGADGSTRPTGLAAPAAGAAGSNTAAVLAAAKAGGKDEKEKAADTKGQTGGNSASSVSGNVIGVGQNAVVSAIYEQTEIAKQSMTYLEMIAHNFGAQNNFRDITEKGGTPITPATRQQ
jgi:hypothetical protein